MIWSDKNAEELALNGLTVIDQFLTDSEVNAITALPIFTDPDVHMKKAGIGSRQEKQINEAIRGDQIHWLEKSTAAVPVKQYLERIEALMNFFNASLFLSLKDYEIHATHYPPGTFYKRHLDQFRHDDHRKLSAICYLNIGWRAEFGGQLRIYNEDGPADYLPQAGRLVCFRSDKIEHEVLPATQPRRSLTGWLLDRPADLRHL